VVRPFPGCAGGERNNADLCPLPLRFASFYSKSCDFPELLSSGPLALRFLSLLFTRLSSCAINYQLTLHPPASGTPGTAGGTPLDSTKPLKTLAWHGRYGWYDLFQAVPGEKETRNKRVPSAPFFSPSFVGGALSASIIDPSNFPRNRFFRSQSQLLRSLC
jgi:hypothetical protein